MISEGDVQIGFNAPTSGPLIAADSLTRIITEGEALGFDYVTISNHIMVPRSLESKYRYLCICADQPIPLPERPLDIAAGQAYPRGPIAARETPSESAAQDERLERDLSRHGAAV